MSNLSSPPFPCPSSLSFSIFFPLSILPSYLMPCHLLQFVLHHSRSPATSIRLLCSHCTSLLSIISYHIKSLILLLCEIRVYQSILFPELARHSELDTLEYHIFCPLSVVQEFEFESIQGRLRFLEQTSAFKKQLISRDKYDENDETRN